MRRRQFIRSTLAGAGLALAPGVVDAAARLVPAGDSVTRAGKVADVEATVHARALDFPTTPAAESLAKQLRDYVDARTVATEAPSHLQGRICGCLAYLCGFLAANLADQHDYDGAHGWYGRGLEYAEYADDREARGWIGGRAALMPWYRKDPDRTIHDAAYAAVHSPPGQLGTTLGNALAASAFARIGDRRNALRALDASERATERSDERFTAYSFPSYRWHKFASDVRTHLGHVGRAERHQSAALEGYPAGAVTDPTFVRLDQAHCMAAESPRDAARHATRAVLALRPERALPALLDRGEDVAERIGAAGRTETEDLRHVVRHMRNVAA